MRWPLRTAPVESGAVRGDRPVALHVLGSVQLVAWHCLMPFVASRLVIAVGTVGRSFRFPHSLCYGCPGVIDIAACRANSVDDQRSEAKRTICENKVTCSERSYAHCSMSIYMHPRTFDPFLGDESRSLPVGIYIHACTFGRVLHRATSNESSSSPKLNRKSAGARMYIYISRNHAGTDMCIDFPISRRARHDRVQIYGLKSPTDQPLLYVYLHAPVNF